MTEVMGKSWEVMGNLEQTAANFYEYKKLLCITIVAPLFIYQISAFVVMKHSWKSHETFFSFCRQFRNPVSDL